MVHSITLSGKPMAYQRHRVNTKTGHVYNPQKYTAWKETTRLLFAQHMDVLRMDPHAGPVKVNVSFHFRGAGKSMRFTRPDVDNLAKAILDAGNGILWHDDALVYDLRASKWWSGVDFTNVEVEG